MTYKKIKFGSSSFIFNIFNVKSGQSSTLNWIKLKFVINKNTKQSCSKNKFKNLNVNVKSINNNGFHDDLYDSGIHPLVIISFVKEIMFWNCHLPTLWQIVIKFTVFFLDGFPYFKNWILLVHIYNIHQYQIDTLREAIKKKKL